MSGYVKSEAVAAAVAREREGIVAFARRVAARANGDGDLHTAVAAEGFAEAIEAREDKRPPKDKPKVQELKRSKCRSCGAPIVWCSTPNDSRMPVDLEPTEDGTLALNLSTDPPVVWQPKDQADHGPLRKSHFATCQQADDWRTR